MTDIPDIVKQMAADDTVKGGHKLFDKGAVLDIRPDTKGANVRLASRPGKFESIHLTVKFQSLHSKCSCGVSMTGTLCEHGVAAVLAYRKNFPRRFDYCFNEGEDLEHNETVWSSQEPPAEDNTRSALKKHNFRDLVRNFSDFKARLFLYADSPPNGESRWHQITIKAEIDYEGKIYASSNIRRILDLGNAAGGMSLKDFPPQDQMIMRFLNTHADRKGSLYKMNAHVLSNFLHCLTGFQRFFTGDQQLRINSQTVSLTISVRQKDKGCEISPSVNVADEGLLDLKNCSILAGTCGFWINRQLQYFWLPGVADVQWLSGFLDGETDFINQEEFAELRYACDEKIIPVKIINDKNHADLISEACTPLLTLDWNNGVVQARIFFEYGNFTSVKSSSATVWNGEQYVIRNKAAEEESYEWLLENKFEQMRGSENSFYLDDFDAVSRFLLKTLPDLANTWKIYYSENFNLCARHIRPVKMTVSTNKETANWVEVDFEFQNHEDKIVEWQKVLQAVKLNRQLIETADGSLVKIDDETVNTIKSLPNFERLNNGKYKFSRYMSLMMNRLLGGYLQEENADWQNLHDRLINAKGTKAVNLSKTLDDILREYQKDGVAWLQTMKDIGLNCILADEMGLGKTVQALALIAADKKAGIEGPTLVICPKSLIENWHNEAERFAPELKVRVVSGQNRTLKVKDLSQNDLLITSYALIRKDISIYEKIDFNSVILDEAQNIKNHKSQTAQACRALNSRFKLVLSGTPVENSVKEIWSIFDFILPGLLGSLNDFKGRYLNLENKDADQQEASAELAVRIKPFILRRLKKDLLEQLPPKQEQLLYFDLNDEQKNLYTAIAREAGTMLHDGNGLSKQRFAVLAMLMKLRQICCHPDLIAEVRETGEDPGSAKFDLLKELIYESLDSSHRVLIFSQFTGMLKIISKWLKEENIIFEYLDGSSSNRQEKIDRFNEDESIPLFLLSLKAGGTGLNLTGADTVIHYDMWWNPQVENQATDRTHRIGQTKVVNVMKLIAKNTIEEKILSLQDEKRQLFENLMNGIPQKLGDLNSEDLEFLLTP